MQRSLVSKERREGGMKAAIDMKEVGYFGKLPKGQLSLVTCHVRILTALVKLEALSTTLTRTRSASQYPNSLNSFRCHLILICIIQHIAKIS